jgi:hypothetical protein
MNTTLEKENATPPPLPSRSVTQPRKRNFSSPKIKIFFGAAVGSLGFLFILFAIAVGFWARAHSPHMGFGQMMTKWDSYFIREPWYELIIGAVIIAGLCGSLAFVVGIVLLVIGFWRNQKK